MNPKKILFLCAANVGRSQMAVGYYNAITKTEHATSAALLEDKRIKYNHKPAQEIQDLMQEDGIDISSQSIQLLNGDLCGEAESIILLLDIQDIQSEFRVEGMQPLAFLKKFYHSKLIIYPIIDPYNANKELSLFVRNSIKDFILTLM